MVACRNWSWLDTTWNLGSSIHIVVRTASRRFERLQGGQNTLYLPEYPFCCSIVDKLAVLSTIEGDLGVKCVESFREVPRSEYLYLWKITSAAAFCK